jgi:sulfhydrogenase subunit beta (sulfur reductase)
MQCPVTSLMIKITLLGRIIMKKIHKNNFEKMVNSLLQSGYTIIAPVFKKGKHYFSRIESFDKISFDYCQTVLSPKAVYFPSTDSLMRYENEQNNVKIIEVEVPKNPVIVLGVKPCDAYALSYLSEFFLKENSDTYIHVRKENTTIVGFTCTHSDDKCFCTSLNINPYDTKGTDIHFTEIGEEYNVESITEKGNEIIKNFNTMFEDSQTIDKKDYSSNPPIKFDLEKIRLTDKFESSVWLNQSLQCLGCGACAYSCPTCSCFDIQDESNPYSGERLRCWDSCGFGLFTLHASGHNPRHDQSNRWRNRVFHKFEYSVKNLDTISCVGCGRCIRVCPGGMDISEHLAELATI